MYLGKLGERQGRICKSERRGLLNFGSQFLEGARGYKRFDRQHLKSRCANRLRDIACNAICRSVLIITKILFDVAVEELKQSFVCADNRENVFDCRIILIENAEFSVSCGNAGGFRNYFFKYRVYYKDARIVLPVYFKGVRFFRIADTARSAECGSCKYPFAAFAGEITVQDFKVLITSRKFICKGKKIGNFCRFKPQFKCQKATAFDLANLRLDLIY